MSATDHRRGSRAVTAALLVVPVVFLVVFFLSRSSSIVVTGLRPDGRLGPERPRRGASSDRGLRRVAWFTLWQAAVSTVLTLIVALPGAYVLARLDFPGRSLVPRPDRRPVRAADRCRRDGLPGTPRPGGPAGVGRRSLSITDDFDLRRRRWRSSPPTSSSTTPSWSVPSVGLESPRPAARGCGPGTRRGAVARLPIGDLPRLMPAIGGAAAIVFLFSLHLASAWCRILGGARLATIEVEIHRQTTQLLDLPTAAALAIIQLVAVGAALAVHGRVTERHHHTLRLRPASTTARRARGLDRLVAGCHPCRRGGAPRHARARARRALVRHRRRLRPGLLPRARHHTSREHRLHPADRGAAQLADLRRVAASLIALIVGGLAAVGLVRMRARGRRARRRWLTLPLGTSAVTIGFGFLIALDEPPLDLRTSAVLVPLAQALVAIPFVVRTADAGAPVDRPAAA